MGDKIEIEKECSLSLTVSHGAAVFQEKGKSAITTTTTATHKKPAKKKSIKITKRSAEEPREYIQQKNWVIKGEVRARKIKKARRRKAVEGAIARYFY